MLIIFVTILMYDLLTANLLFIPVMYLTVTNTVGQNILMKLDNFLRIEPGTVYRYIVHNTNYVATMFPTILLLN